MKNRTKSVQTSVAGAFSPTTLQETNSGLKLARALRFAVALALTWGVVAPFGTAFAQKSSGPYKSPPTSWVFRVR